MAIPVLRFGRIDSTMKKARELVRGSTGESCIVMADEQTAGRGRIEGRKWEGALGASLLMTLCLKSDLSMSEALPLKIGLAVHTVLSELAPSSIRIKWPNDIMGLCPQDDFPLGSSHFRKLGGLLCETSGAWILAGVGLNLGPNAYPPALHSKATSLAEVAAAAQPERRATLPDAQSLALTIGEVALEWLKNDDWRDEYQKAMWALGENVGFIVGHPDNGVTRQGTILGIDGSGRLLFKDEKGVVEAFGSGEISSLTASDQSL
ncbi:MAG: biotin--[acetyl-CoA-carboxylase] ligase [Spirochaetae bacterium HGW-Spirochaetae-9]|nr:MAG: biotin--[acetyl-CoA-carboxylase] ligase [Spirochaetae bacterium HGW-Spirochaetae-9]